MGRHQTDAPPARPRWVVPLVAFAVLVAGGGGTWWAISRSGGDSAPAAAPGTTATTSASVRTACASNTAVSVAVAGPLLPAVQKAADLATTAGACATYAVTAQPAPATAADIAGGKGPNVWIPDSSTWVSAITAKAPSAVTTGPSVALSPLVVAIPTTIAGPVTSAPTWSQLVNFTLPVQFADPTTSASSRLALTSAYAALGTSPEARIALGAAMIRLSRTKVATEDALYAQAAATPASAFPAEEAVVAAYNAGHASAPLTAAIPADGTSAFDHPFVTVGAPTASVKAGADALLAALQSTDGKAAVAAAGFRNGTTDATAKVAGLIGGAPTYLPAPPAEAATALQRSWTAVGTEMRMLAVVDTSGSMKDPAGASTRMALAHQAGLVALSAFPPGSVIGLWRFGYRSGGINQDWLEVVPQRGLQDVVGRKDQRALLVDGFAALAAHPAGGTGLYDTILAAYQKAKAGYDPTRVNSVVLLTDGKNDDPYSISLDGLLTKLAAAKDPAKPIVVITVAIGPDADSATLQRVTQVTGGRSYTATAPEQITGVFVDALLNRS